MRIPTTVRWLGTVMAVLALPAGVEAQASNMNMTLSDDMPGDDAIPLDVEVRGGVALPVEDLTEYADPGYHVGAGAALYFTDHVGVRIDGDVSAFPGETPATDNFADLPDLRLWSLGLGLEFDVGGRDRTGPWSLQANVGVGSTTLSTDGFIEPDPRNDATPGLLNVQETYPSLNGGVEVGFDASDMVEIAVGTRAFYTFADESDLQALSDRRAATTPLGDAVSMPITARLSIGLPNR